MRCLHIKNGFVVNVVEYPGDVPESDGLADVVPAVTGLESVGDAFDVTGALKDRLITRMDAVVLNELFRLTNEVRALKLQATITKLQYRNAIRAAL